jgi:hypothetical protein
MTTIDADMTAQPDHRGGSDVTVEPVGHHQLGAAQAPPDGEPQPMTCIRTTTRRFVMWAAIAASSALLGLLLAVGWYDGTWP